MKKNLILLSAMLLFVAAPAFSQFTFTAAPGLNLNSAYFGYKAGKVVPFIGLQYMGISVKTVETGTEYDAGYVNFSDEMKIKGSVFMPTIGVKFFAVEKNQLKGYLTAAFSKPFLSAKLELDGQEVEEISDAVDKVKLWGATAGVGAEYFFDDNFSLGGEFGLQIVTGKYTDEYTEEVYNEDDYTYQEFDFEDEVTVRLMPTYSKISLNFYF